MKTMQTRNYIIGLFTITAVSLLGSCSKSFLEVQPKGKVIAQSTSDYDMMLNNAGLVSNGGDVSVPMGDEIIAFDNYFTSAASIRSQRLFRWDDDIYDDGIFANEMATLMANLYTCNKIINEVPASTYGTDAQKQAILAEARVNRAYINFNLINLYGKPYNAATAATDPGYPIVTAADLTATSFTRASVQEMYDFILKDITGSIPYLPVTIKSRIRIGKAAAELLLGKVYVFMAKFDEAKKQLDAALTDLASTSSGGTLTNMGLYDLNVTMISGGTWGWKANSATFFSGVPAGQVNTENICWRQSGTNYWSYNLSEYTISTETYNLFVSTDKRLNYFTIRPYLESTGTYPLTGALRRNAPSFIQNGMTMPELYLLRAECAARLGDTTTAKADLLTLRVKRMSSADATVPTGLTQKELIDFVLNERTREFALQGYRWFDMRRLSVDPLYSSTTYSHRLYGTSGTLTSTFTLKPERLTLRLPLAVMAQNPEMENNP